MENRTFMKSNFIKINFEQFGSDARWSIGELNFTNIFKQHLFERYTSE